MLGQAGLFDVDERLKRLSDLGDPLLAFTAAVDFEVFRPELTRALAYSDGSQGGRPPFGPREDVQDPGDPGGQHPLRRAYRVSDQRPPVVHAVSRVEPVRPGSRRTHDLAVPGEADQGRGDQAAVRPVRRGAARGRLRRHGRANRRRLADRRAEAAQHRGGEEGGQGGAHSGGMESQAGQAPAQGSRRALDGQVQQGQGEAGWDGSSGRHRHSDVRLPEPCLDRPRTWADPALGREGGDVAAIPSFLKVLDRLDRYQKTAKVNQVYDDDARKKLFEKLNRVAANLGLRRDRGPGEGQAQPAPEAARARLAAPRAAGRG